MSGVQTIVDLLRRNAVVRPKDRPPTPSCATATVRRRHLEPRRRSTTRPGRSRRRCCAWRGRAQRVLAAVPAGAGLPGGAVREHVRRVCWPCRSSRLGGNIRAKLALPKLEAIAADGGVARRPRSCGMLGEMDGARRAAARCWAGVAWLATDVLDPRGWRRTWQPIRALTAGGPRLPAVHVGQHVHAEGRDGEPRQPALPALRLPRRLRARPPTA
jgi:hypothetical protein